MPRTEDLVQQRAPEIARVIQTAAKGSPLEADFRRPVEEVLTQFADEAGIPLRTHHEYTLATGRADTVYNRLVIEYKRPGQLGEARSNRNNVAAVEQTKDYIESIEKAQRIKKGRLVGVVTDGRWMIYCRHIAGRWRVEDPVPVDADSVARLLTLLVHLQAGAAMVPSNLIEDFGSQTITAQRATRALYTALQTCEDPLVGALFEQWRTFFGEVTGYEKGAARLRGKAEFRKFAKGMGLRAEEVDPPYLFFAVHTYFALLIKFVAWLTVSRYLGGTGAPFAELQGLSSDELRAALREMERGETFRAYGVCNLLEGDFFAWYLRAWGNRIEGQVRDMLKTLSRYDPATLEDEPELTRDLLKQLYQYLVPRHLRHDLGEYYTPDWLAQRVLNMVDGGRYKGDPRKRVLDPACGSGTFLVLAIKATRDYCRQNGIADANTLELILSNVVGIDLNPLAVIASRTNYLLALGDLLEARGGGDIEIPVYLADSIMTPSRGSDLFTQDKYQIITTVGVFEIPQTCATRERIAALADVLDECVEENTPTETFMAQARERVGLSTAEFYAADATLTTLYEKLADLHRKGLDGLWARIIKNAFAPIFLERFDYVVGNPPWVNWTHLPGEYREQTKPLWQQYRLFPHTGLAARLGGAKDDISILMTYVALDKYLKTRGKLGFIITQTVFQTVGGGKGFRRFQIGSGEQVRIVHVDDLTEINPFKSASNKPAIFIAEKGSKTSYPVKYTYWRKKTRGISVPEDADILEIKDLTMTARWVAQPIRREEPTSPWITGKPKAVESIAKVIGEADYRARSGTCGWANGIYWVEILAERPDDKLVITNTGQPDPRAKAYGSIRTEIEKIFVYPLVRGRDIVRWHSKAEYYIVAPQDSNNLAKALSEEFLKTHYSGTFRFFSHFEEELKQRSGFKKYFDPEKDPFYSMYNIGPYTFARYKVGWARQDARLRCAVISDVGNQGIAWPICVPDQTCQFVPIDASLDEAHYVCACLNSSPAGYLAVSYTTDITTRVMKSVRVPKFDPPSPLHQRLAQSSQRAHQFAARRDKEGVQTVEAEIDRLAAELWELSQQELEEIQRSLEELG